MYSGKSTVCVCVFVCVCVCACVSVPVSVACREVPHAIEERMALEKAVARSVAGGAKPEKLAVGGHGGTAAR